jgi:hypothetical protein
MLNEVVFITDRMFDVPRLPDTSTALPLLTRKHVPICVSQMQPIAGETRLDRSPSCGKIEIAERKSPNSVNVIGQENNRINREGPSLLLISEPLSQQFSSRFFEK